jgi:hypothetical protein
MTVEPAFAVPCHVRHGLQDELQVWFTDPPGVVVQLSKPQRSTVAQTRWLLGPCFDLMRERFPHDEKLILVLDYRNMTSRDTSARTLMMDRARDIAHLFSHVFIVPPLHASPVYLAMLHAAVALVSMFGAKLEIVDSLSETISQTSLRALAVGEWALPGKLPEEGPITPSGRDQR